jgi:membrane protein YqaA with SNARE-associated domain
MSPEALAFAWLCIGCVIGAFFGWHAGYMRRLREEQAEWRRQHEAEMQRVRFEGNVVRGL